MSTVRLHPAEKKGYSGTGLYSRVEPESVTLGGLGEDRFDSEGRLITANDVLHSWWVPDLAIKKDAIPGIINETWFRAEQVGTYRGKCTELCGKDHGYMPVVVEVVEPEAYQAWLDTRAGANQRYANNELTATPDAALAAGE